MTRTEKRLILKIARNVRSWAERFVDRNRGLHFCENLGGMCGICSYQLWTVLQKVGIKASLVKGNGHCYVVIGKWLLDVTATQFRQVSGHSKVIFRLVSCKPKWRFWDEVERFDTETEILEMFNTWPDYQSPLTFRETL